MILSAELLAGQPMPKNPQEALPALKLDVDLVSLNVVVTDHKGQAITELEKENFKVYEDRVEQPISFFSHEDAPVSWGLVLDRSRSMEETIQKVHQAAVHLIDEGSGQDEMFIETFNTQSQLVRSFTSDRNQLTNSIFGLEAYGRTAVFDAVALALDRLQAGRHLKKALSVVTDGDDNSSELTFKELIELAEERDALIYVMGIFEPPDPRRPGLRGWEHRGSLERLAEVTGGRAYFPINTRQCQEAVKRIALEVSHQCSLGYYPTRPPGDGEWRKLKVVVVHQGQQERKLIARTRSRYFVPGR
jgi:Ca-activated chloride channel family protein